MERSSNPTIPKEVIRSLDPSILKEAILKLNNGSVTIEQVRASFTDDLSSFKKRLESLNIFVWNEANGPVRIHGGDYSITIVIKEKQKRYVVEATNPWEKVRSMIEADLRLSTGCYKLTYNFQPGPDVWVKTDRDWHFAVEFSKVRDYFVYLDLEICPFGMTANENAFDHAFYEDDSDKE